MVINTSWNIIFQTHYSHVICITPVNLCKKFYLSISSQCFYPDIVRYVWRQSYLIARLIYFIQRMYFNLCIYRAKIIRALPVKMLLLIIMIVKTLKTSDWTDGLFWHFFSIMCFHKQLSIRIFLFLFVKIDFHCQILLVACIIMIQYYTIFSM